MALGTKISTMKRGLRGLLQTLLALSGNPASEKIWFQKKSWNWSRSEFLVFVAISGNPAVPLFSALRNVMQTLNWPKT